MYSQVQEGSAGADSDLAASPAEDAALAVVHRPTSLDSLKAEIARAMQVAAEHERERIDAGFGDEETVQVEKIFSRASAEAAELSKHAEEDVNVLNGWYKDEVKRVRAEADQRIDERRTRLEQSLAHHGTLIDSEIESVHSAVQGYRGSLGAFFGRLADEGDPSAIARLAGDLPNPPDLDAIRAETRSRAMQAIAQQESADEPVALTVASSLNGNGQNGAERVVVPVMDPGADEQHDGSLRATTLIAARPGPSAPADIDVPAGDAPSEGEATATAVATAAAVEAPGSQPNVAARIIRALTSRPSSTPEAREDE